MTAPTRTAVVVGLLLSAVAWRADVQASVIPVGSASFPAASPVLPFTGLTTGTEVNGLTVEGVQFSYSLGNGQLVIGGGPSISNNVSAPDLVSIGASTGTLTVQLPTLAERFGFGYALLTGLQIPDAVTIAIFSAATPLGSLSYLAVPDPLFAGGFAGLLSTVPFNRVAVTFSSAASSFALDNIRVTPAQAVPEPATWMLLLAGGTVLAWSRRRTRLQFGPQRAR